MTLEPVTMLGTSASFEPEIYLDWNSTSLPLPELSQVVAAAAGSLWGNPASVHAVGRRARAELEQLRQELGDALGFAARDGVFTCGGTEANNLALARANTLLVSRLEHPSVTQVAQALQARGGLVAWLDVAPDGRVLPESVERALAQLAEPRAAVVTLMAANHETGVLQPLPEIARLVRARGARLHVDAVQLLGKAPLVVLEHADSVSVTAHKIRGPKGLGALFFRGQAPAPVLLGGAQERGLRPGTQDAVAAAGFRLALSKCVQDTSWLATARQLRDRLERELADLGDVNGAQAERLPHVSNISFRGFPGPELVAALDLAGVCVSSGSACSAGTSEPSAVISAMLGRERAKAAVRFSLGPTTTEAEIDRTVAAVRRALA